MQPRYYLYTRRVAVEARAAGPTGWLASPPCTCDGAEKVSRTIIRRPLVGDRDRVVAAAAAALDCVPTTTHYASAVFLEAVREPCRVVVVVMVPRTHNRNS